MDPPLVLAGPILRRVEPSLVTVWVALREACTVKLALWENRIQASDAEDGNVWFRSPDPGATTIRIGDKLHMAVVALRLPSGKSLVPERLYSYDLEITPQNQPAKHTLKSLGLLGNDPPNADADGDHTKHLALGYEPEFLPCLVLPPKALKDLRIVHGSCRDPDNDFPDGLAWLDDLFSGDKAYQSALKRPHQLFLTGDQIYADEVPRPLLRMLSDAARTLFGATTEQLPLKDPSDPNKTMSVPADLVHFPVGHRGNLIRNEAGMTTTAGGSHLMSFGEFCAMYLFVWSNALWPAEFPGPEELPPKVDGKLELPDAVKDAITKNSAGDVQTVLDYGDEDSPRYETDRARLVEFHRTLPKVRRALANVPTYMIFDDHEITDDWYLTQTWRDRVLGCPLGSAIIRNGMLAYALFQGWGNDPVKFEPRAGLTEKQPHEQLLDLATQFLPAGAATGPDTVSKDNPASRIAHLLGLDLRNEEATDGSYAETNPPLKWFYTVPGEKHQVLVLDCRTRRAFASRISPPGNIGKEAQKEQIPDEPNPKDREVWIVVSSLPVLGPPIFDELFGPLLFRVFDFKSGEDLQRNRGTKRMPGTNPDAVEAWAFDPGLFENLLSRLKAYSPVLLLSGDVHYSATNAMSYWYRKNKQDAQFVPEPVRLVQFISSGLKNVMLEVIVLANRSFSLLQKMIRARIGAERLGWEKNSPNPVKLPQGSDISPRLRSLLNKSPVLIPTIGWRGASAELSDWAWRVAPIRDIRPDKDRPKMAQPVSLFPDAPVRKDDDLTKTDLDAYHRTAERHARQLDRLNNCRQILFASSLALLTFDKRTEKDKDKHDIDVTYAIQDLYTVHPDPEDLIARPKPLVYTRHEVPLRDVWEDPPTIKSVT